MKASRVKAVISLAALLVLGWLLWQQQPVMPVPESSVTEQLPLDIDVPEINVPDITVPELLVTPTPPPVSLLQPVSLSVTPRLQPAAFTLDLPEEKTSSPPLPPNPHAFPPWRERLPYGESQIQRGLYLPPLKLDKVP